MNIWEVNCGERYEDYVAFNNDGRQIFHLVHVIFPGEGSSLELYRVLWGDYEGLETCKKY